MIRLKIFLLIFSLYLAGCVTVNEEYIDKNYVPEPKLGKGVFFGSVTQASDVLGGTNARFIISSTENENVRYMVRPKGIGSLLMGYGDFVSEFSGVDGNIFAFEVPAGEYQLFAWNVDTGNVLMSPKVPPKILRFDVGEGEVAYIGSLHMNYKTGENFLGMNVTSDAMPEIKNNQRIDLAKFLYKYKHFKKEDIVAKVLPVGPWLP